MRTTPEERARYRAAYKFQTGKEPTMTDEELDTSIGNQHSALGSNRVPPQSGEPNQGTTVPYVEGPMGTGGQVGDAGMDIPTDTGAGEGTGEAGTWEAAAMAVSRSVPAIIESLSKRQPNAATPNIAGRRVMDIPTAGGIYGKREPGFQSLLARLLAGGR